MGLFILFFTEMWERFSYYGMRALLVLYLKEATVNGGMGWTEHDALELYGWYTMLVYVSSIPGGILADRVFGQKKSVMIGGLLLVAGHSLMAVTGTIPFFGALALIVAGVGMLKPNISTMVGGLYSKGDGRRDSAFTIFYMGINLGALLASIIVGYVGQVYGWHWGFGLAGIGMALGQIVFMLGQKHLKDVGNFEPKPAVITSENMYAPFTSNDWKRVGAILVSFTLVILFFAAFEQAGGFMNLYTDTYVNRWVGDFEIPASMFQSWNPLFIIVFGGLLSAIWIRLSRVGKNPSSIAKMSLGTAIMGIGFFMMAGASLQRGVTWGQVETDPTVLASAWWIIGAYWFHTMGELFLSPVSLSFITRTAPKRIVASMMGTYFAVIGFANYFAAKIGQQVAKLGELTVFVSIAVVAIVLGLVFLALTKQINRWATAGENQVESRSNAA